jgi:hypothetical protein
VRIFKQRCQNAYFLANLITTLKTKRYRAFATLEMNYNASHTEKTGIRGML